MPLITLNGIHHEYRLGPDTVFKALRGVDLEVEEGEFVALMGPSGSGKSTLLTIIGGLTRPTAGQVLIDGIDVYGLSLEKQADFRREYIGFVFQQFQLLPYLTAQENVELPLLVSGTAPQARAKKAREVLARVGLEGKEHHLPNQLSGGEQQRVGIARALVNDPLLLLADEPTGNLDSRTGEEVMHLFEELNHQGLTIIMVTHNPENAAYAQRLLNLKDGLLNIDQKRRN